MARWNLTTLRSYRDASNYVEEHFYYDNLGNVVSHVDARGKTTTVSFADNYSDSTNHYTYAKPTLVTNAEGHEIETLYDFNSGLPMSVFDPRGLESEFTYDLMNRPATITEPNGRVTSYTYTDSTPKVEEQVTVASGVVRKTETTLDKLNRPIQVKQYDPAGNVFVDTEYDDIGHVKKVSTPYRSGSPVWTETAYDVLGRPTTITNPDSTTVSFSYAANTATTTDEAGKQQRHTVNALGQLTKVEEPNPTLSSALETTYSYYVFGPLAQVTQGSQTRTFTSDWLGRITQESHPETGTTSYGYDDGGLVTSRTDARSIVTSYTYDDIGRPLTVTYSDSTPDVTYTYDQSAFTGFLTAVDVDGVTSSTYEYNSDGALSEENVTLDGVNGTFTSGYTYDLDGRLLTVTYPSGRVVTRAYDAGSGMASDRMSSLSDGATSSTMIGSVADNAAGQITARSLGSGIAESRNYNSRFQLEGIGATASSTTLMDLDYGYGTTNNTGRILSRIDSLQPEHSVGYSYDAIGRLSAVNASTSNWGVSWVLDRYGNRTSQNPSGLASGRVGSQTLGYANNKNTSFSYDAVGNVTNDTTHTYTYDAENRLIQVDSSSIQYVYDSGGRRARKTVNGTSTFYLYGLTGLMSEFSTDDTLSSATAAASTDRLEYRLSDPTGTAVLLMAPDGTVRSNNRVFPFGEQWQLPTGSSNTQEFTSYQRDGESGLDYAMARYYASRGGRFMVSDPGHVGANIGDPQSWNAYVYSRNDPINLIDPDGLCWVDGVEYPDGGDKCPDVTSVTVTVPLEWIPCVSIETGQTTGECGGFSTGSSSGNSFPRPSPNIPASITSGSSESPLQCVKRNAESISLQSMLKGLSGGRAGNGWLSNALLGNDVVDLVDLGESFYQGHYGTTANTGSQMITSKATEKSTEAYLLLLSKHSTDSAVTLNPSFYLGSTLLRLPEVRFTIRWTKMLKWTAKAVGSVKIPYDIAAAGFSAVGCGSMSRW